MPWHDTGSRVTPEQEEEQRIAIEYAQICENLVEDHPVTESEQEFLESIARQARRRSRLTEKQIDAVDKIKERIEERELNRQVGRDWDWD